MESVIDSPNESEGFLGDGAFWMKVRRMRGEGRNQNPMQKKTEPKNQANTALAEEAQEAELVSEESQEAQSVSEERQEEKAAEESEETRAKQPVFEETQEEETQERSRSPASDDTTQPQLIPKQLFPGEP